MADPATLALIAAASSVAGTGIAAVGAVSQGEAASQAAAYNAQVAANNAKLATQNASTIAQEGEQQTAQAQQQTKAKLGAILANQGASGVDVNTGSAVDVRSSAAELGELNAINIRANAVRQAYGQQVQAAGDTGQSQLDKSESSSDAAAGFIKGGSTLLSGASDAYTKFANTNSNTFDTSGLTNGQPLFP